MRICTLEKKMGLVLSASDLIEESSGKIIRSENILFNGNSTQVMNKDEPNVIDVSVK